MNIEIKIENPVDEINEIKYFQINGQNLRLDSVTCTIYRWKIYKTKPNCWKAIKFSENRNGYLFCRINRKFYRKHRLIYYANNQDWDITDGSIANNSIDHIDGNRKNNNIINLRVVTHQQNHFNQTKAKGYCWHKKNKKWLAQITVDNKNIHLGYFDKEDDARTAYLEAKEIYHKI
jgi:hypothetical protein